MGMSENIGILPGGYFAGKLGSDSVECPRPRCEGGLERCEDPYGRKYTIMCHWCKGHGTVSPEKASRWFLAEALGPPSDPPLPH